MIAQYNLKQVLLAMLSIVLGGLAYAVTYFFITFVMFSLKDGFPGAPWSMISPAVKSIFILGVTFAGFRRWRTGMGHHELSESIAARGLDEVSGGSHMINRYTRRVTGPAYFLGEVFLAGPLQWLGAYGRLRQRIPNTSEYEEWLVSLLAEINAGDAWQDLGDYAGHEEGVEYLVRMGRVRFSSLNNRIGQK